MVTTAGKIREMLAGLPDDSPVFADVWTATEMQDRIDSLQDAAEDNGDACPDIDLSDASTLRRALDCLPDLWATCGDDVSDQVNDALYREFVREGGAE